MKSILETTIIRKIKAFLKIQKTVSEGPIFKYRPLSENNSLSVGKKPYMLKGTIFKYRPYQKTTAFLEIWINNSQKDHFKYRPFLEKNSLLGNMKSQAIIRTITTFL